jgi:hypothetical protein
MTDEYIPTWDQGPNEIPAGIYFWEITVWDVELPNPEMEKPYVKMFYKVTVGDLGGYKNSFRLYITPAAKSWALWCLRKFGYPEELLGESPIIRKSALINLQGKIQVEVYEDERGLKYDVKGFERLGETELEDREKRHQEFSLGAQDEVPVIDINADVVAEDTDLSFLDGTSEMEHFIAQDSDLPDLFFEESPSEIPKD